MSVGTREYAASNLLLWDLEAITISDSNTGEKRLIHSMISEDPSTRWSPPNRPALMFRYKNTIDPNKEWSGCAEVNTRMRKILFDWFDEVKTFLKFEDERTIIHAK